MTALGTDFYPAICKQYMGDYPGVAQEQPKGPI